MDKVLDMGELFVSDFVKEQPTDRKKYSLDLYLDKDIKAVRLHPNSLSPGHTRWHRSGDNIRIQSDMAALVQEITSYVEVYATDVWLDIGCNKTTLLSNVDKTLTRIAIDPDLDPVKTQEQGILALNHFTREGFFKASQDKKARVITCINTFPCIDDPVSLIADLWKCLDDDGIIVLEMVYAPGMVKQIAFDNICHENIYYYDMNSIGEMASKQGLRLVDASFNTNNGGSFRLYLQKTIANVRSFGATHLQRNVCDIRVMTMLIFEEWFDVTSVKFWQEFKHDLKLLKEAVLNYVQQAIKDGKTVYGYGTSTRANTMLQYLGLTKHQISALVDPSANHVGLHTIGTDIPVISEDDMRANPPDYLLVMPWYCVDTLLQREEQFLKDGGKLLVPVPVFDVIGITTP